MSKISKDEIEHLAQLARLILKDEEKEKLTQEIGEILSYAEELNQAETQEIELISQISGLSNIARPDEVTNENKRDKMIQNAPEQKEGFIKVKKIFE